MSKECQVYASSENSREGGKREVFRQVSPALSSMEHTEPLAISGRTKPLMEAYRAIAINCAVRGHLVRVA